MKKRIWHISDTHGYHSQLRIRDDVDIVIHSGDFSNYYNLYKNLPEAMDFLHWYKSLPIKHKILIAGNHDAYPAKANKEFRDICKQFNITYLENESIEIMGIKIWGSPCTPTFGDWHFMRKRDKLDKLWKTIPEDTDVIVVHGPPKGILDKTLDRQRNIDLCGCNALRTNILFRVLPKLVLFGHIHNNDTLLNAGVLKLSNYPTTFSNGSVVTDRKFGTLTSQGNVLEIECSCNKNCKCKK